jgi:hypothetical protein
MMGGRNWCGFPMAMLPNHRLVNETYSLRKYSPAANAAAVLTSSPSAVKCSTACLNTSAWLDMSLFRHQRTLRTPQKCLHEAPKLTNHEEAEDHRRRLCLRVLETSSAPIHPAVS